MKKKTLSALILIITLSIYWYLECKQEDIQVKNSKETGTVNHTNFNYLPSSTTGQIVHHKGYSLSYSEKHEQAEWVAYALNK
jgi:endonuclease G